MLYSFICIPLLINYLYRIHGIGQEHVKRLSYAKIRFDLHGRIHLDHYIRTVSLRWIYTVTLITCCSGVTWSQIFPDLEGEELFSSVVEEYKPRFVETYSIARELMYREIYNHQDSVHTLYSGYKLFLPPSEEFPIQFLARNASADGILAEHIYPKSKGAKPEYGNAFSDLHNLAPAKWSVNEARANFPFRDIADEQTDRWFYRDEVKRMKEELSQEMIGQYAEVSGNGDYDGFFEPREDMKGDIARSVFYFYTMYREEALKEDPDFFSKMREDLCTWHNTDGVDDLEMDRNLMKAMVQDGKTNPFIMDCSLANRMYCIEYPPNSCTNLTTSVDDEFTKGEPLNPAIKITPNPNDGIFTLDISNISPGNYQVDIYFLSGQLIYSLNEQLDYYNSINMWNTKSGLHIIHLTNHDTGRKYSGTFEVIK